MLTISDSQLSALETLVEARFLKELCALVRKELAFWVENCDAAFKRAVDAGAKAVGPPTDMFWGDRCAGVADPFGYLWSFATHQKDLSVEEMRKAGAEFAKTWAAQHGQHP